MDKDNIQVLPSNEQIQILKKNKLSYIYWLAKFKDWIILNIIKEKPINNNFNFKLKKELKFVDSYSPNMLLNELTKIRYKLLCNNNNLKYYLIHFNINGEKLKNGNIKFKIDDDDNNNKWYK